MQVLVVAIIASVVSIAVLKAIRNKRVNEALLSDIGKRYLANLEATGRATQTADIGGLGELVADREAIVREARTQGIDLNLIDSLIRDAAHSGRSMRVPSRDTSTTSPGDLRTLAEDLYQCGERGAATLARAIQAVSRRAGSQVTETEAQHLLMRHAHALVWFTISKHLPVEVGKPIMQAHLDALLDNLVKRGAEVNREDLEATIGRQWMAYVQRPEAAGGQLFALASLVLQDYFPRDRLGVDHAVAVAETIIGIVKDTRSSIEPVLVS